MRNDQVALLLRLRLERDIMQEALERLVAKHDEMHPMRTAGVHVNCNCLRCCVDAARAALSRARGEV